MKKILILSGLFIVLFAGMVSARPLTGIGLYGNLVGSGTGGGGGGIGLTLKFGNFPILGLEWNIQQNYTRIGGSMDWWVVNQPLGGILSYYLGIGAYFALNSENHNNNNTFVFGGRIPIGLQIFPVDQLEIFLEGAPMIVLLPTIDWNISIRVGFRVLF